ncbi:MAG TPA: efflux RND transporter periplasmic adaptor subunit [Candidatus Sulfotelmatobacter sp.]|nr:efflux RND transporter periplasmic adaptor subunit [Candidatus Sulfotelmatobacter sp.]
MNIAERPATNDRIHTVILEPPRRRPRIWLAAAAVLCIVAIIATLFVVRSRASAVSYTTVPAQTGSLAQTVTATGTLNPQNTINVGTQVSGTINTIQADYNSHVKKGQVLATIDPTTFNAALAQAQAQLAQAQANAQAAAATATGGPSSVAEASAQAAAAAAASKAALATAQSAQAGIATAQSTVTKDQSALTLAQQTLSRDRQLLAQGYVAQNQVDTDQTNFVAAQQTLDAAKLAVTQAQAQTAAAQAQAVQAGATQQAQTAQTGVSSAQAANQAATAQADIAAIGIDRAQVTTAEQNVKNTIITSPVDGTVIARDVTVGQTVAASLQTPTLFSIAQDLSKMELDLAVGEPDIGHVAAGDPVSFSVLAFPNRTFTGTVEQVRQAPTTVNNVVTYTVVVLVGNTDGSLLPGMTANATIQVAHVDNATIVPLAALSFQPPSGAFGSHHARRPQGASAPAGAAKSTAHASSSSPWGATQTVSSGAVTPGSTGRVFVLSGKTLRPVPVHVGLVSATQATVTPLRGTLAAGDAIVTADTGGARATHAAAGNPLAGGQGGGGRMLGGVR